MNNNNHAQLRFKRTTQMLISLLISLLLFTPALASTAETQNSNTLFLPLIQTQSTSTQSTSIQSTSTQSTSVQAAQVATQAIDPTTARDQLLNGVTTMGDPGGPGTMVVWGDNAYAVANYKNAKVIDPMMAVAGWGQGRVIAMPDHQWLNMDSYGDVGDTGQFYRNGLAWLTGTSSTDTNNTDIKIVVARSGAKTWLASQGYTNVVEGSSNFASHLSDADVLVGWLGSNPSQTDLDAVSSFVQNGGGLFLAEYGIGYNWWWGKAIPDAPGNKLLHDVGIGFTSIGTHGGGDIDPTNRVEGQITGADVLAMLANPSDYSEIELNNGGAVLGGLFNVLPEGDPLLAQLDAAFWTRINQINPTPSTPVSSSFEQALLRREATLLANTPVDQVTAHRTVEAIYGVVPADAPRVNRTVTLDTANSRWLPTGLYAAPGEVVTINVPDALVGQGYKVRVNAHKSDVYPRSSWERPPEAHRWFDIDSSVMRVANAFGGLIFIDVGNTPPNVGNVDITIQNAVEAPYFVLGQHSDQQWRDTLRNNPAPYTLLVGEKLMISMPTHDVLILDEPTTLMTWWDQVVTLQDDLADQTQFRTSPELMNIDVQIGYGAAHAGYPYQAYDKHWGNPADLNRLLNGGSWGDFHELGHNHQRGWWTFSGDGEVTVNIFSNYTLETMNPNTTGGWAWSADPAEVMRRSITMTQENTNYSSKSNRWAFWFQLADGFGWDAYRTVFADYEADNANNPDALPSNNQEEKNQWLVRFSQAVGYNMTRFMRDTWDMQVSQSAVDQVSHLPTWMPVIGTTKDVRLPIGLSHTFDLAGGALALDGVATVTAVSSPANGTLTDNGDGTVTYTPNAGFAGQDSFTYTLQSSGENSKTFTINIQMVELSVLVETWHGISGSSIANLTTHANYPDSPDSTDYVESFAIPSNQADSYGARLRAYLVPSTSGSYTFWIASDDNGELWLGSNDDAATAQRIAHVPGWTSAQQWNKFSEQQSVQLELVAGKRYYIEALMKEGGGGDNLAVAWQGPSIGQQIIGGEFLQVYDGSVTQYPPVAVDDNAATDEDMAVIVDVLGNDSDENGDVLTVVAVTQGTNGTVNNNGDGTVTYTPNSNMHGNDSFTYTISDGTDEATATVHVTINAVNDAPIAQDDTASANAGVAVAIDVLTNDSDVDGDALTIVATSQAANGTVNNNGDGTVTYTPNAGFSDSDFGGKDSFTYTVDDGHGSQATATVTINVTEPVDDGLLAHWTFDEGEGNALADVTGNGYDGTRKGNRKNKPQWVAGNDADDASDGALDFNGSNGRVKLAKRINIKGDWTVTLWVNRRDNSASTTLLNSGRMSLRLEQWHDTGKVGFTRYGQGDYTFDYTAPVSEWVHLAFVKTDDGVSLYADGVFVGTNPNPITLRVWTMGKSKADRLDAVLDDVRVYERALSDREVMVLGR